MNNLDIIARMAINGWPMIPLLPGQKQTYAAWGSHVDAYNFNALFAGQPVDCNAGIITGNTVAVVDFDNHGPEPNGLTAYRRIEAAAPAVFHDAIVEMTPSGGVHAYYTGLRGMSPYTVSMTVDGVPVAVEVLTGRKPSYCWPTVTDKGGYQVVTKRNFLNTRPEDLPGLPGIFHKQKEPEQPRVQKQAAPKTWALADGLHNVDADAVVDGLVESYLRGAVVGERHKHAQALARALAGHDILGEGDVRRGVEAFFNRCGRSPNKGEVDGIVKYAVKHPDNEPPTPWTRVHEARRSRILSLFRKQTGGAQA
ncbi:bifunctional DNA primase/polymerase [Methanocella sp. MCL-LM]|uniref:bifunctional DNA primase/polymerase n=1 Tax=Methanocella sp. MCL-LM TaxID=3412035 RepID=UPI003C782B23